MGDGWNRPLELMHDVIVLDIGNNNLSFVRSCISFGIGV